PPRSPLFPYTTLFRSEGGRILVGGTDIAAVTQESLRANIGMVSQDTALLHRSIRDNILFGNPDASEAEMIEAARRAEAHDFILADRKSTRLNSSHVKI